MISKKRKRKRVVVAEIKTNWHLFNNLPLKQESFLVKKNKTQVNIKINKLLHLIKWMCIFFIV